MGSSRKIVANDIGTKAFVNKVSGLKSVFLLDKNKLSKFAKLY